MILASELQWKNQRSQIIAFPFLLSKTFTAALLDLQALVTEWFEDELVSSSLLLARCWFFYIEN